MKDRFTSYRPFLGLTAAALISFVAVCHGPGNQASPSGRQGDHGLTSLAEGASSGSSRTRLVAEYSHSGCTMRDGPGDFAQNCFSVTYSGPAVHKLWSYIQAAKFPGFPATVCSATFEVSGQLANGTPYRSSKVVSGCGAISSGVTLEGLNLVFKPGTTICSRSLWQGSWSSPACVGAPDDSSWSGRPWNPYGK